MRKKKLEKLKQELKKEIELELKKEQEKKVVIEPIVKLNVEHSKEELEEIRKSFLKIFLFSLVALLSAILLLIIKPWDKKEKQDEAQPQGPEVVDKIDLINDELIKQEEGKLELRNIYILKKFNELKLSSNEYSIFDGSYIYSKEELSISNIPSNYLLNYLAKSDEFKEYIGNTDLLTKEEICNKVGSIRIPIAKINNIFEQKYNASLVEYPDFIYTYYVDDIYSTYVRFTYSDGFYVSSCEEINFVNNKIIATPIIESAYKSQNEVRIKVRVAFTSNGKIYSDYGLTNIISTNIKEDILNYIMKADSYEYIYILSGNNYLLDKITKINQE